MVSRPSDSEDTILTHMVFLHRYSAQSRCQIHHPPWTAGSSTGLNIGARAVFCLMIFLQHQEVQESQRKEHLWQALPRSRLARSCRVTASCWWRLTSRDTQPTQGRPRPGHLHCVPLLTYGLYEENSPDSGSYLNAEILEVN